MKAQRSAMVRLTWALIVCIASGCTYTVDPGGNGPGTLVLEPPGGGPAVAPAPGLAQGQTGSSARPVSGPYRGEAEALNDPGGFCTTRMPVTNWIVTGSQVSFGSFSGTIDPNGALMMQAGPSYVQGQFTGSHFAGRFSRPQPSCTYRLTLDPVG
jgi:hypothetical protein